MKKSILASILAVGLVSVASAAPTGDLILGFRDTVNNPTTNAQFDLGSVSLFSTGGTYATGGTVDTGINAGSLLSSTYGSGYASDNALLWGVVGTNGQATGQRVLYVSAAATGATGAPSSAAWPVASKTSQATQAASFISVAGTTTTGGSNTIGTGTANSWSNKEGTSSVAFGAYNTALFEAKSGSGFADLYVLDPQTTGPGVGSPGAWLGTFSISAANGDVLFTTAAIPEPSTYAAILGVATLGFAALRRRKQALVA